MIKYILTIPARLSLSLFIAIITIPGFIIYLGNEKYTRDVKKLYYDIWR